MNTGSNPGSPAHYVNLAGTSGHPHGGRYEPPPLLVNRRVQVTATDHPATDRWISLTTVRLVPTPTYRVAVVDGHNHPVEPPTTYPTLTKARNAANRLYRAMTKETS